MTVVKKAGARLSATSRTCPVTGSPPPETTVPLGSMTWPRVAVVEPMSSWPATIFCAAAVSELSAACSSVLRATKKAARDAASTATATATVVASTRRVRKVTRHESRST